MGKSSEIPVDFPMKSGGFWFHCFIVPTNPLIMRKNLYWGIGDVFGGEMSGTIY